LTSPDQRSLLGHVILDGQMAALPIKLQSVEVTTHPDGFGAKLTVHHGDAVAAEWTMRSHASGTVEIAEKLVAIKDCVTAEVATGLIGVLNNVNWIYETGQRSLSLNGETWQIPAHSGEKIDKEGIAQVLVDNALRIDISPHRRVVYRAATKPERGRATDRLYLNSILGHRAFRTGETIAEWSAVLSVIRQAP